jgi:error-prone DNA polymerase
MGFYALAQIVRDAREHEVEVRPVDINHSLWDCTFEPAESGKWALRLGLRQIKRFAAADAKRLIGARPEHGYSDPRVLWRRSGLGRGALERLAEADAFRSIGLDRRRALSASKAFGEPPAAALRRRGRDPGSYLHSSF